MNKKFSFVILLSFGLFAANAQNTGIGTTTPTAKLEVKNPLMGDVKISSNNYLDTTQLILSNRNPAGQGTDFRFRSIRELGLYISSLSDVLGNNSDSSLIINPQGRIGLGGLPATTAILDIKSNNKGILIPRLTTAQRTGIVSPPTGLLVFDNSTRSFWFYSASSWSELAVGGPGSEIRDANNDTKVQTEKFANDDLIRFVSKGFEIANFNTKSLQIDTAGSVFIGKFAGQLDGGVDNIGNPSTLNVAIGNGAGQFNINGSNNVYVGAGAGRNEKGKWNTYIGYNAGNGTLAQTNFSNTYIGRFAGGGAQGSENIHMGAYAGAWNEGTNNIFIGNGSGGGQFAFNDNGSNNVVLGHRAGAVNIFGSSNNVLIGNNVAQTDTFSNRLYIHNGESDSTTALIFGRFDSAFLQINGNVKVKNEIQTPARTGFSNMVPICYGNVKSDATINPGSTPNFKVVKISAGFYSILISAETYQFQSFATIVTPQGNTSPRISSTDSGGGQLYVKIWDSAGAATDCNFHFVVYKP